MAVQRRLEAHAGHVRHGAVGDAAFMDHDAVHREASVALGRLVAADAEVERGAVARAALVDRHAVGRDVAALELAHSRIGMVPGLLAGFGQGRGDGESCGKGGEIQDGPDGSPSATDDPSSVALAAIPGDRQQGWQEPRSFGGLLCRFQAARP